MTRLLLAVFLTIASLPTVAADISITVTNIPAAKGTLLIGLYDSAANFLVKPTKNSPKLALTSTDSVTAKFDHVHPGTYAIAVIQDLNGNGRLDKNFLGMPKEPLAFSVIKEIPKGKPSFEACSFTVATSDLKMTIPLTLE